VYALQWWCGPLGLFEPICGGHLLPHLSFQERFYYVYKNSLVGLGGTHLPISYYLTRLFLLRSHFLHFHHSLLFTLIIGLFDEGYGMLQSS
jgi:hypothetical protein